MVRKGVIDFTAFLSNDKQVIIKELTVIDVDSQCTQHWIFQPPQNQQLMLSCWDNKTFEYHNRWMSTHFHGLYYSNGFTPYDSLPLVLAQICRDIQVLFATTTEKAKALEEIFNFDRAVISLELLGCPLIAHDPLFYLNEKVNGADPQQLSRSCLFHDTYAPGFYCTHKTVQTVADWCRSNAEKIDLNSPEVRVKTFADWKPLSPTGKDLADQGFIYMSSTKDSTKCIYCGVVLMKWEENDQPVDDHQQNSPFCIFVRYHKQLREAEHENSKKRENEEEGRQKKSPNQEGEDVCGCFEMLKIKESDIFNFCYA